MNRRWWTPLLPLCIVAGVLGLVAVAARNPLRREPPVGLAIAPEDRDGAVLQIDRILNRRWQAAGVDPAQPADDLTVLRRLSLALRGSIPSLEEIRVFEADAEPSRL
jgi:hypothetical protein